MAKKKWLRPRIEHRVKNLQVMVPRPGSYRFRIGALRVEYILETNRKRSNEIEQTARVVEWRVKPSPTVNRGGQVGKALNQYYRMRFIESFGMNGNIRVAHWNAARYSEEKRQET